MSPPSPPGTTPGTSPIVLIVPFRTDFRSAESRSDITAVPSGRNTVDQGNCMPSRAVRTRGVPGVVTVPDPGLAGVVPGARWGPGVPGAGVTVPPAPVVAVG